MGQRRHVNENENHVQLGFGETPLRRVRALERFRAVLHGRSLKLSKVRESIARAALSYDGHFSVDDLLRLLQRRRVHDAHLATIYRAVPLMIEAGLIQPALVAAKDGQRYEVSFEREHHDHLVCTGCGIVLEYSRPRSKPSSVRSRLAISSCSKITCSSCGGAARPAGAGGPRRTERPASCPTDLRRDSADLSGDDGGRRCYSSRARNIHAVFSWTCRRWVSRSQVG